MKIVFIGAGNLATNLATHLSKTSHEVIQIFSRTIESAKILGNKIGAPYTSSLSDIETEADIYIFSIKDSVIKDVLTQMPDKSRNSIWIHTSGSVELDIFNGYVSRYGVFYPLQTFSKNRIIELKNVPLCLESSTPDVLEILTEIATSLSSKVYELSTEKRRYLHLTGVLACNFTNHLYHISKNILEEHDMSFDLLIPLIEETTNKIKILSPEKAQTGPAIRYDLNIINKHLQLIENDRLREIYRLMSESIHQLNS